MIIENNNINKVCDLGCGSSKLIEMRLIFLIQHTMNMIVGVKFYNKLRFKESKRIYIFT